MVILLTILYVAVLVCLLIVLGVHPQLSSHSKFELRRRAREGDSRAVILLKRHELLRDIFSLQRVLSALLLVLLSVIGVELFHWAVGLLISLIIALEAGAVARLSLLQKQSQRLYERYEPGILATIERWPLIFRTIRTVSPIPNDAYDIESKEELLAMVEGSGEVLTRDEKQLIVNGLTFDKMQVSSVMTPKSMIDSVPADELLGPLTLDALHKTGHSRFPVIDGDIDHVVGMLYIQDLLTVGGKTKTHKAAVAMEKKVFYIREDQSLQQALAAFLRTRHHLFVVINEYRETVGLLSLEDVMEALLGRKINDEFDTHEDLRKVAERNPRGNNSPKAAETV